LIDLSLSLHYTDFFGLSVGRRISPLLEICIKVVYFVIFNSNTFKNAQVRAI